MQAMYRSLRNHVTKGSKTPEDSKDSATQDRLFTLPRELRDEIYRKVLCSKYLICWPQEWRRDERRPVFRFGRRQHWWRGYFWSDHRGEKENRLFCADIALLLTSKAISHEAMEIMYQESSFSVYVGWRTGSVYHHLTSLPSQQVLDRIQNLEMRMCMCDSWSQSACEMWLKFGDTMGKTCRISLYCWDCMIDYRDSILEACQSLIGFRVVTLTLDTIYVDAEWAVAEGDPHFKEVYRPLREDFREALEPHLGHSRTYEIGNVLALDFYPRKHIEDVDAKVMIGRSIQGKSVNKDLAYSIQEF